MLIAIDYDDTYTADPNYWDKVIALGKEHGHEYVCVTARCGGDETDITDKEIPTIYTCGEYKKDHCKELRITPDIWIDDAPEFIGKGGKLAWD